MRPSRGGAHAGKAGDPVLERLQVGEDRPRLEGHGLAPRRHASAGPALLQAVQPVQCQALSAKLSLATWTPVVTSHSRRKSAAGGRSIGAARAAAGGSTAQQGAAGRRQGAAGAARRGRAQQGAAKRGRAQQERSRGQQGAAGRSRSAAGRSRTQQGRSRAPPTQHGAAELRRCRESAGHQRAPPDCAVHRDSLLSGVHSLARAPQPCPRKATAVSAGRAGILRRPVFSRQCRRRLRFLRESPDSASALQAKPWLG